MLKEDHPFHDTGPFPLAFFFSSVAEVNVIDDLTVEQVQGCGHFVPWEAPQKVNAAMDAFLGKTA